MGFVKFSLVRFRGIKKENFIFYLKEIKAKILGQNLYQNLLKAIRENPVRVILSLIIFGEAKYPKNSHEIH